MTKSPNGIAWENRTVPRAAIVIEPDFRSRHGALDAAHVKTLVAAVRRGSKLTPVTLWRDAGRNSFVLLDGEHRLAAWLTAGWRGEVPARLVTCSRRDALLIAAGANTRDALPLSQRERADLAWRLVREPVEHFTKGEIARVSGIAERTVTTMRAHWRTLKEAGREATGAWWRDQKAQSEDDENGGMRWMTDAERERIIEALAVKLQKAVGRVAFKDEDLFADALDRAFGRKLRAAIDRLYSADEVGEWLDMRVEDDDADVPF